jgi:DNA-binding response OmpR family regulator
MAIILVIDESRASKPLGGLLTAAGHRMLVAENTWHGLAIVETQPTDLVILNLDLAGASGFTFMNDLRRHRDPGIATRRVIAFTKSLDPQTRARLRPLRVSAVLSRRETSPFEFLDAVRAALADPEGQRWKYGDVA